MYVIYYTLLGNFGYNYLSISHVFPWYFQAEKAAFDEAEKKREEEVQYFF